MCVCVCTFHSASDRTLDELHGIFMNDETYRVS